MRNLDAAYLGRFLGLAEAAEELRGRASDESFVTQLIAIAKQYRAGDLHRGDTITNLEALVAERMSS